jgi:hypothetical protein
MDTQGILFPTICASKYYQNCITNQSLLIIQMSKKKNGGVSRAYIWKMMKRIKKLKSQNYRVGQIIYTVL